MIATWRGVLVLAIVAVLLAIVDVAIGPATHTVVDRTLFSAEPQMMTVEHEGEPPVDLIKRGNEWRWRTPDIRADAATVDGILTALRSRWHRTGTPGGARHGSLRVNTTDFVIGEPLAGTEQTWIIHGGRALLVDNWVARALVPSRVQLRIRDPLANIAGANVVEIPGVIRLEGTHRSEPPLWVAPALVQALDDAAAAVEIVALDGTKTEKSLELVVDGKHVAAIGTCASNRILITTPDGDGCVEAAAWTAVVAAVDALRNPAADPRPLPFTPKTITLDGSTLDHRTDAYRELLAALATPGELVPRAGKPVGTLVADDTTLEIYKDGVARAGEPMMIKTPALATIARPASAYRDPTRWREDATTIQSITVDGKRYTRGAVIGEWTGTQSPALLEALASTLAIVRAPHYAKPLPATRRRITVTFAPPAGGPSTHTIEIADPSGCFGKVDDDPAVVPADLCTAAFALQ